MNKHIYSKLDLSRFLAHNSFEIFWFSECLTRRTVYLWMLFPVYLFFSADIYSMIFCIGSAAEGLKYSWRCHLTSWKKKMKKKSQFVCTKKKEFVCSPPLDVFSFLSFGWKNFVFSILLIIFLLFLYSFCVCVCVCFFELAVRHNQRTVFGFGRRVALWCQEKESERKGAFFKRTLIFWFVFKYPITRNNIQFIVQNICM